MKLTDWMPAGSTPMRAGVYEIEEPYPALLPDRIFAHWNGQHWTSGAWASNHGSDQAAVDNANVDPDRTDWQRGYRWRGVAK